MSYLGLPRRSRPIAPLAGLRASPLVVRIAQRILPLVIGVACLAWINATVSLPSPAEIIDAFALITLPQWISAAALTAISFWAVGGYDGIWHRSLATGISAGRSRLAGMTAVGLGQTTGASAVVGTFVRWRMIPALSLTQATTLSACVAFSFILAWGAVTAATMVIWGARPEFIGLSLLFLGGIIATVVLAQKLGRISVMGRVLHVPTLGACLRMVVLTAIDTLAAAAALWVLLPAGLGFGDVFALYLLALGAALVSNTPAGLGPFDLTLLTGFAVLSGAPEPTQAMSAFIAFRVVYYFVPAALSIAMIAFHNRRSDADVFAKNAPTAADLLHAKQAPRSETMLMRHAKAQVVSSKPDAPSWLIRTLDETCVALLDPLETTAAPAQFKALQNTARATGHKALVYKCMARTATMARRAGWQVLHISDEAQIDTAATAQMNGTAFRQLRRKLRKAQTANVTVAHLSDSLPIADLQAVNRAWAQGNRVERGFSMGTLCPDWIAAQRVYAAWKGADMVGFITFHEGAQHRSLDLMRLHPDAPDGTMHALVAFAIRDAHSHGIAQISLAAVPPKIQPATAPLPQRLYSTAFKAEGLRQFKQSFDPAWQPLYACAPTLWALLVGGFDVARHVRRGD